jgi:hypothetical protein
MGASVLGRTAVLLRSPGWAGADAHALDCPLSGTLLSQLTHLGHS